MSLLTIWRKAVNAVMLTLTGLCTIATVSVLLFILGYLVWNGARALNWDFFTQLPKPVGEVGGGMANALLGSAKLLALATLMGVPVGFIGGVYLSEFGGKTFPFLVRYTTDLLNGVPSIVIGIFAYAVVVMPMKHFSTLAGALALGIMVIPITMRSTEQFLRAVPESLREGALALGASKWRAVATVVIPAAIRGILTGTILGVARVAGETAPLLFTSFSNRYWGEGFNQPTASLPVMIFTYAISPYEDWHRQAWAAGLVLLALMLAANISARLILAPRGAGRS
jgi:phosphate transport system permease protein